MNVLIGDRMREYLVARGIPESKLCVIENWADGEAIQPKASTASALRDRLSLFDRFVVCYSGNLGRAHEFETLLGAAQALKKETGFTFLIIGSGAKMEALKQAVAARSLESFHFLPYQPRDTLEDSLAAADVHLVSLLPTLEGLIVPSKLYGILAAGRPLIFIGDPDGDIARVIERAQCGRRIAVGDSIALSDALRNLAAHPEILAVMGARARQLLCEDYSQKRALEKWVALIETV
jgi:glycosyltransferase involved in cell wall biosynthesis